MGYQVGVTPLQMVAAVERDRQRRRTDRAARRPGRVPRQPPIRRQAEGPAAGRQPDTAATLTTIMEAVVDGWHRQARADPRLHGRRQDGHRFEADRRPLFGIREQRVVRRVCCRRAIRRSRSSSMIDAPHANGNSGGAVAAPIFRRIAGPALRYLGVAPTINPAPPVLVARNAPSPVAARPGCDHGTGGGARIGRRPADDARSARHERPRRDAHAREARIDGAHVGARRRRRRRTRHRALPSKAAKPAGWSWAAALRRRGPPTQQP